MGMKFEDWEEVSDFGSIYAKNLQSNGVNEYGLDEVDIEKLDLLKTQSPHGNATYGSTAICDDTGDLYVLTKSRGWAKFGGSDE